ncbi:hypothetical protein ACHAPD_006325 [Fusarium lateritium]
MIDTDNLRTASLYINNQLLSRGLLRDGQSIEFAGVAFDGHDVAATMGRIRDAEHRESLSTTMRTLRADNLKHTNDIARLTEKHNEAKRKLDIAEASEAALKTQMKSADATIRGLKEEVTRTKGLVAQTRAACATDVRRRDRQIDTLKKQLNEAGRARGARGNPGVTTITITGDIGDEKSTRSARTSEDYDLHNETNAFLANLAQNLSEENEAILMVMRKTMQKLRDMSGWSNGNQDTLVTQQQGWQDMAAELDSVLDHMRTILTNPSFVPIEEVMIREEEISRLKDGWVKMESRWTEAVHLIDGWRKRMAANGRPICDEELQMGLRLSPVRVRDVEETRHASGLRLSAVAEEEDEDVHMNSPCPSRCPPSVQLVPESEPEDDDNAHESDAESDYDVPIDDYDVDEPNVQILQQSTAAPLYHREQDSSPLPEPPQLSPLKDSASAGNRGSHRSKQPEKRDFTTIAEEDNWDLPLETNPIPIQFEPRDRVSSSSSLEEALLRSSNAAPEAKPTTPSRQSSQRSDQNDVNQGSPNRSPRRTASRLPLPRNAEPAPQQSPLTMATIAAKLAASEREADAARVRAKLRAARSTRGVQKPKIGSSQPEPQTADPPAKEPELKRSDVENVDPVKRDPVPADDQLKPEKRRRARRTSKKTSRRRSTLSPWELESLMNGNVQ